MNQTLQGRSGGVQPQENPTEAGLVHALICIQARPSFHEIVSTTNEYGQTLAHLAILYDYPSLLRHLVDWCIDLAIADVNGLTALHCAYMKGDLHSVRVLRRGGAPEAAKDKLGRIPSDLQPEGFGRDFDADVDMHPPGNGIDEQVALGGRFSALALTDLGHECDIPDEFHLFRPPTQVEIAAARALRIRRYPDYILTRVFRHWGDLWLTHLVDGIKGGTIDHGLNAPFVLQAVCRSWRDIARSTTQLWADIFINCGARNRRLIQRLDIIVKRARNATLGIYIRDVHTGIFRQRWFQDMRNILNPTVTRWSRLTVSFVHPSDVHELLVVWPLNCVRLRQITFYGCVDGTPTSTLPFSFPPPDTPIRVIHLRNIVWWESRTFAGLSEIAIGPSHADQLTQNAIVSLLRATPGIQRLKLLAFEHADIPPPTHCLPKDFRLLHLRRLAASPVLLRTTLVGFDSPDILPVLASVSIHFDAQDEEETPEDNDNARRKEDLRGVGLFLQRHSITALKLRGLHEKYSLEAVTRLIFVPMNCSRIETLHFVDCVGHTTKFIEQALRKVPYFPSLVPSSNHLLSRRASQTHGGQPGGAVFLFPHLMTLRLTRCHDVDASVALSTHFIN